MEIIFHFPGTWQDHSCCGSEENVPTEPITRDTQVLLLWEERGQNDLLFSASLSLPEAGHIDTSQEVGKVIYLFTTSLVS